MKQDTRDMRTRVDGFDRRFVELSRQFEARFGELSRQFGGRFARLEARDDDLRDRMEEMERRQAERINGLERSLASAKVWALLLFIAQAAAVYGTLARTMGWIRRRGALAAGYRRCDSASRCRGPESTQECR